MKAKFINEEVKPTMNINATLGTIIHMLGYFSDQPDPTLNSLKHRMKLLINDVYGYLQKNEGFKIGISEGVSEDIEMHRKTYGKVGSLNALKNKYKWIFEHGIPWDASFPFLVKAKIKDPAKLLEFIRNSYAMCYVTRAEDAKLPKTTMPEGWTPEQSWTIRYEKAGVKVKELPRKGK